MGDDIVTADGTQTRSPSPHAADQLDALTSLRFFAAAMIVTVHTVHPFFPGVSWPPPSFVTAVTFFFVLSGFILAHVYPSLSEGGTRRFLAARVARIWPAHIAALLLLLLLLPPSAWSKIAGVQHPTIGSALANVFLVHAWIPHISYNSGFNAVAWSISTEFAFYLCFPLLIRAWDRTWRWKLAAAFGLLCVMVTIANRSPLSQEMRYYLVYFNPAARLFEFTIGMALAPLARRLRHRLRPRPLWWTAAEIAGIAAVAVSMMQAKQWSDAMSRWSWVGVWGSVWLLIGGVCLPAMAGLILVISLQAGHISRLLRWRLLVLLGEVSYSLYLLHQVLLRAYTRHLAMHLEHLPSWGLYALFWLATVAASCMIWSRVERPMRSSLMRMLMHRRGRSVELAAVPSSQPPFPG